MTIRDIDFRGQKFKIMWLETYPQHASWASFFDEDQIKDAFWHIKPGEFVLDIGASFGPYALTALLQGAKFVWAWSPQGYPEETEQEILQKNLELNGWSSQCKVYETGLFDKSGYLDIISQKMVDPPSNEFEARTLKNIIKVETLSEWAGREMKEGDRIDWIKLDVEGAEVEILNGGIDILQKFRPKIKVENHIFRRASIEQEVRNIILSLGGYREVGTMPYTASTTHSLYVPE